MKEVTLAEKLLDPVVLAGIFQGGLNLLSSVTIAGTALYVTWRLTKRRHSALNEIAMLDEITYLKIVLENVDKVAPQKPKVVHVAKKMANEEGYSSCGKFTPSYINRKRSSLLKEKSDDVATSVL